MRRSEAGPEAELGCVYRLQAVNLLARQAVAGYGEAEAEAEEPGDGWISRQL